MPIVLNRYVIALFLLVFSAVLPLQTAAQDVANGSAAVIDEQRTIITALGKKTDQLELAIKNNSEDDARLVEIRLELEELSARLLSSGVAFRPRLSEINSRVEQLGPPPAEGQPPEPDIVTQERRSLAAEKAEINAILGMAEIAVNSRQWAD